ncbi:unnamed protein product [Spirodela intermedia]|uniref:Reverse transcriptase Ty1/copia-type domain-containing protein n=1 Tax=Spirodela intermedia TaxID=51605 RepID=A0A7I8INU6_SPIIN|nr:unnamed protein product [Spirodela intermedia]CAA6658811.1 unnamed protein product [Spirodela intermedia]
MLLIYMLSSPCLMSVTSHIELTCFNKASKDPFLRATIESHMNIIGCKWVFKLNHKADGTIDCHKSRLIVKAYKKKSDLDYDKTFSPIIKVTTNRVLLAIAINNGSLDN